MENNFVAKQEERTEVINKYILDTVIYPILGKKETWGRDLTKMGHKLFGQNYSGTFPADKIPNIGKNRDGSTVTRSNTKKDSNLYCILNLDYSHQPGSHWLACAYDINSGKIYVYDSFGRDTEKIMPTLVEKFGDKLVTVDQDAEQLKSEDDCGARCLAWLYIFDRMGSEYAKLL